MKTAGSENPNRWAQVSSNRAHGVARQNRILLIQVASEARKIPAMGFASQGSASAADLDDLPGLD
jgi:hypothetical protein